MPHRHGKIDAIDSKADLAERTEAQIAGSTSATGSLTISAKQITMLAIRQSD
jgi:hypothetical protein